MSPAVQKGPLGVSICQRPKSKGGTPRGLAQGGSVRLGYLALLRSILRRIGPPRRLGRPPGRRFCYCKVAEDESASGGG